MEKFSLLRSYFLRKNHIKFYLRVMRITTLMLFLCLSGLFAATGYSQKAKVTINQKNVSLHDVLTDIEGQTDYLFIYSNHVDVSHKVSVNMKNKPVKEVLDHVLSGTPISYALNGAHIVLSSHSGGSTEGNQQETIRISGIVRDEQGPLTGVSVIVKGTSQGTVTDLDGKYMITVSGRQAVLVYSFIGYIRQEATVGNRSAIDIQMEEDLQQIDEVIVIGYGTQKKVNLTGAVSAVSGDDLIKRPVSNPVTMLQGQVPGLSIVQGTGQPGQENASIRIRGQGTYSSAGSNPLVLIDGVPGNLASLNANDIESVSVLKDAASASIYGARAANGVILVTTKSGMENDFKLSYNLNVGVHNPTKMLNLVTNSADYMRLSNEAKTNSGIASATNTYTDEMISAYENATDRLRYPNYDWLDYAFNPAWVQNHDLSLSGGTKGTTYNISLGYIDQPGTMKGYEFQKYNFRANLKSQLKDWITIGTNIFMERGDVTQTAQGQDDAFLSFLAQAPTYSPMLPDGSGYVYSAYPFEDHNKNMAASIENEVMKKTTSYDASAQLWMEIKLFKDLTWYTKGAVNFTDASYKDWRPVVPLYNFHTGNFSSNLDVGTKGLTADNSRTFYTNFFTYLKYDKTLAEAHNLGVQVGYSQEYNRFDNLKGYRQTFYSGLQELNAGTVDIMEANGYAYEWALMSLFGRLNYDYKGRYLLETNVRYDGTSRMANNKRWGWFPSFSAGWRLSEESFMKDLDLHWLNNLKIRGSYGLLGNQNINVSDQPYPYQSILVYTGAYPFDNNGLSTGVAQTGYANQNIRWESTSITDIGIDVTLFGGLSFSYDWYRKNTTDILRSAQASNLLGLTAPIVNSGAMVNSGHEITVQYAGRVQDGVLKGLNYGAGAYFNTFKNEARNFGTEEISGYYLRRNGLPYDSYYMLECIGVFQTEEEIKQSPKQFSDNVKPGDLKYLDANGDGIVDNDDRVVVDGKFPKFEYSFNLFASWKGFDISAFFQGVEGRKIFVNGWGYEPFRQGTPPTTEWLTDRWTGPGTSNWLPRITYDYNGNSQNRRNSTWFLQDASYLRLKNLTFGYTLPKHLTNKVKCEKLRLYFSGDNLFTITDFKGLDPERAGDGRFAQYPQNKIISFGLNVEF